MAALLLSLGVPAAAHAQSNPDLTSRLLIAILVKKGVLSQTDADSILQEAQAAASAASAAAPAAAPASPVPANPAPDHDGDGQQHPKPRRDHHVTYIPQVVPTTRSPLR